MKLSLTRDSFHNAIEAETGATRYSFQARSINYAVALVPCDWAGFSSLVYPMRATLAIPSTLSFSFSEKNQKISNLTAVSADALCGFSAPETRPLFDFQCALDFQNNGGRNLVRRGFWNADN